MNIVKRIGLVETDKNDRPVDDVKIVKGSVKNAWVFTERSYFLRFLNIKLFFYLKMNIFIFCTYIILIYICKI